MTIVERALELVTNGSRIGHGSGHAAQAFIKALGGPTLPPETAGSGRLELARWLTRRFGEPRLE